MNSSGIEILSNPQPCAHIVYPYTDDRHLAEAVCTFASAGLRKVEAVLLVLSEAHHSPVRERLENQGFDLASLERTGHLVCENARDVLGSFMIDGVIDEPTFKSRIGRMIEKSKTASGNRPVRVFGEMVDLIWKNHPQANNRLEQLWNEVIQAHSVPLLCAYSLAGSSNTLPQKILDCHSHAIS